MKIQVINGKGREVNEHDPLISMTQGVKIPNPRYYDFESTIIEYPCLTPNGEVAEDGTWDAKLGGRYFIDDGIGWRICKGISYEEAVGMKLKTERCYIIQTIESGKEQKTTKMDIQTRVDAIKAKLHQQNMLLQEAKGKLEQAGQQLADTRNGIKSDLQASPYWQDVIETIGNEQSNTDVPLLAKPGEAVGEEPKDISVLIEELDKHEAKVYKVIIAEVIRLARYVLANNKCADEFVMAMGMFSINRKGKSYMSDFVEDYEFAKLKGGREFYDFITEHNERFKITGDPMRFTATSEITTNW